MREFVPRIDEINELAEMSPGFVWRYTDTYDPVGRPAPFQNPLLFFNMSAWRDVDSLREFVFQTDHRELLRRGMEWTRPAGTISHLMWWIDDASMPTVDEAVRRFIDIFNGVPANDSFTFANLLSPPEKDVEETR